MKLLLSLAFVLFQLLVVLSAPVNNSSTEHAVSKRTYVPPDMIYYSIYFMKPESWGDEIYFYVHTEEEELKVYMDEWPGKKALQLGESNNYFNSFPQKLLGHSQIIFTDGKNQSPGTMQKGFDLVKEAVYTVDGIIGIFKDYDSNNNYKISYGNSALIYYGPSFKNINSPNAPEIYVHYKKTNGEWTDAKMYVNPYTHYYSTTIDLGDAEDITLCFTDKKGTWDNNNEKNYYFKKFENIYIESDVKF